MTVLRSAGKSVCTPRGSTVIDIEVACTMARPPPLPAAGPLPSLGVALQTDSASRPALVAASSPSRPSHTNHTASTGNPSLATSGTSRTSTPRRSVSASACSSVPLSPRPILPCNTQGRDAAPASALPDVTLPRADDASAAAAAPHCESACELRAENLRLQRELEQTREQLLSIASGGGASTKRSVVSGGFRGSAIGGTGKKAGSAAEEVGALRHVLQKKNQRIAYMEQVLAELQAEGSSQERHLADMQQCLVDASQQITTTGAQREALERSVEALNTQLDDERRRVLEVQRSAMDVATSNEELVSSLEDLRHQHAEQLGARSEAEDRAAKLQAELADTSARAADFEAEGLRLQRLSIERCEVGLRTLCDIGFRSALIRICWEMWARRVAERRLAGEIEDLRLRAASEAERAALRSAEGHDGRARAEAMSLEIQRLQQALQGAEQRADGADDARRAANELLKQLEARVAELQVDATKRECEAELKAKFEMHLAKAESAADALHGEIAVLKRSCQRAAHQEDEHRRGWERREKDLLAQAERERGDAAALRGQLDSLLQEQEGSRRQLADREAAMRKRIEDLERRLREGTREVQASAAAAAAAREAAAVGEARTRELEQRVRELQGSLSTTAGTTAAPQLSQSSPGGATSSGSVATDAVERDKRVQREETLLSEIRKLEHERDEAKAQLLRTARAKASSGGSPRPLGTARKSGLEALSPAPCPEQSADVSNVLAGTVAAAVSVDAIATTQAAAVQVRELERELGAERELAQKLRREVDELQKKLQCATSTTANTQQLELDLERVRQEVAGLRSELLEVRTDLSLERGEVKKLRNVREEQQAKIARVEADVASLGEARAEAHKWRDAAMEATALVRSSLRILVTAPKVAINVGTNEFSVKTGALARDIEQIRGIVSERVMPGFQRIAAVAEEQGEEDVRRGVQGLVEELAVAVQREVYRVLPQAEGTASWDGFGSRLTSLK